MHHAIFLVLSYCLILLPVIYSFYRPCQAEYKWKEIKMNQKDANAIRQAAEWLSYQSVSSSGDSQASITKADLDNFKAKIVQTLLMIAENDE